MMTQYVKDFWTHKAILKKRYGVILFLDQTQKWMEYV